MERIYNDGHRLTLRLKDHMHFYRKAHCHADGQFICSAKGNFKVKADNSNLLGSPVQSVWIPAGHVHETRSAGEIQFRTLHVGKNLSEIMPTQPHVVPISMLLQALIDRISNHHVSANLGVYYDCLEQELASLTNNMCSPYVPLPIPSSSLLRSLCNRMLKGNILHISSSDAAYQVAMSRSTFNRKFQRETGMTFGDWRQNARILTAVRLLAGGASVLSASIECGYNSTSAFAASFKDHVGVTPSHYRKTIKDADRF